ncbi:hypothetical protein MBLNU13_g05312t1 [Cladosporium sp. NU13]
MSCRLRLGSSLEEVTRTLDLDSTDTEDVRIYYLMLHEAEQGRQRLVQNRDALLPQFKHNTMVQPPYHRSQIDFKSFLQETKTIHLIAYHEARARYDVASGPDNSNAAISQLLWQALRRGERNG